MASFVKISVVKSMRHISAQMNFYPYFPHLFYDLCEIQQKTVSHTLFTNSFVKTGAGKPVLL
jgi:hypothetical protein